MEKLSVVTDQDKTKTSAAGKVRCPSCGGEATQVSTRVTSCPKCGTKPFEQKP